MAMKAVVIDGYGGSDRLQVREVAEPGEPGPGQIRLRVRAAGVNPVDWMIRKGSLRLVMPAKFPLILGYDAAGEVDAIGPEVTRFQPGDAVYGGLDILRQGGSYAELALARESAFAPKPRGSPSRRRRRCRWPGSRRSSRSATRGSWPRASGR